MNFRKPAFFDTFSDVSSRLLNGVFSSKWDKDEESEHPRHVLRLDIDRTHGDLISFSKKALKDEILSNIKNKVGFGHFGHRGKGHHCHDDFEARTIDGEDNNLHHTDYGSTGSAMITISGYAYSDGISAPNDLNRPNPRHISNVLFSQVGNSNSDYDISNYLWMWGQFIDHDITLTREGHEEAYDIAVPMGDAYFDPYFTGEQTIEFTRSGYADGSGTDTDNPRLQVNDITAFIDASMVYGSDEQTQDLVRGEGGTLLMSAGDLLPLVEGDHGMQFQAGDVRANENVGLTSLHTLFVREHNYWVEEIKSEHPEYSDEEVFQRAKATVEAEIQHITYDEFLTKLLGQDAIDDYHGYRPNIDPQIATEFATAAFRVGHTMLSSDIFRLQENGDESEYGHLTLQDAFFRPDIILTQGGIDEVLRGAGGSYSQNIDCALIDDVRNFLFGPSGSGGFDLVSLNIQRGRDHGLADFNTVREAYGLDPINSFEELTDNAEFAQKLSNLYGDISNLDLWVGGLVESPYDGGLVGETFHTIIAEQFTRLRDGDRFWYEERLDDDLLQIIQDTTLSDIIVRNTDVSYLQDDVFVMNNRIGGDENDNTIDGTDDGDLLIGFAGDDHLNGGSGEDTLYGGDGDDHLYGGSGADNLYGEAGHDIFVFKADTAFDGIDTISGFNINDDSIDISDLLSNYNALTDTITDFVQITDNGSHTTVSVDMNGGSDNFSVISIINDVTGFGDEYQLILNGMLLV